MENSYDIAVIGGGILGLATARALNERAPRARLVVLEKEAKLATHQTGNNSCVIHSGIYYKPGSYKAKLCVEGKGLMLEFCQKHGIRVDHVGKVIVATEPAELPRLQTLYERGIANGVPVEMIEPAQLREIEPHAKALRAIRSPSTAIVDYKEVCAAMTRELTARGVTIETNARVTSITRTADAIDLETPRAVVRARRIVNCAGLYSDVVARMAGARVNLKIIPFRGEYYMIRPERQDIVRGLIYPVPDPEFPFLGVHLTRPEDVTRGGAGVRAQAVSPDGSLVDDFRILAEADAIHVLNAPSPGATASIAIGRHIAGLAVENFGLK